MTEVELHESWLVVLRKRKAILREQRARLKALEPELSAAWEAWQVALKANNYQREGAPVPFKEAMKRAAAKGQPE